MHADHILQALLASVSDNRMSKSTLTLQSPLGGMTAISSLGGDVDVACEEITMFVSLYICRSNYVFERTGKC